MIQEWVDWATATVCRAQTLQSGGGGGVVEQWPASGQLCYIALAVLGVPDASHQGRKLSGGPQVGGLVT